MSPMLDVQKRHSEVFRLRLGDKAPSGAPRKLTDAIRVTSPNRSVVAAFVAVYGGEVRPWEQQHEAYLPTMALPVLVLPGQSITAWWELYRSTVCERRCDGYTEQLSGKPCVCPPDIAERMQTAGACRPMTRINIACPEVAVVGAGSLVSHGMIAAETLPQSVAIADAALSRGLMIPAVLRVLVHEGKRHYVVPQLEIVGVSIATLDSGEAPALAASPVAQADGGTHAALPAGKAHVDGPAPSAPSPPNRPGRLPPPPLPNETPSADDRKAMRDTLEALTDDERMMTYSIAKAADVPNIDGPHFSLAHRDRLMSIVGQARVIVACRAAGVTSDDGRHEVVAAATDGASASSKTLTAEQVANVVAYCAGLDADDADQEGA